MKKLFFCLLAVSVLVSGCMTVGYKKTTSNPCGYEVFYDDNDGQDIGLDSQSSQEIMDEKSNLSEILETYPDSRYKIGKARDSSLLATFESTLGSASLVLALIPLLGIVNNQDSVRKNQCVTATVCFLGLGAGLIAHSIIVSYDFKNMLIRSIHSYNKECAK